ncbi:ABC transporter substrate-binding protein [Halostagnicola kamekurae]|uniref:ABC-type Fe3+-hydroxamate transport system, substrate-binding protein n=1 Tax=Halostagnicola kamekurae TaxID=619731 RepID=A0A1I6TIZ5_9EURY|nr:ABC transporter substrate-binding protein [Halostagnicola kamekurae]SFS89144.1 ABC-type Fe3+-hydroxamate transport system, substrate-binding protein [Halostagnicola kamekurae]
MTRDSIREPTRRTYVKYAGAVAGGGLLAGCIDDASSGDGGGGEVTHTASMAPMGEVSFSGVPENVMIYSLLYADMAVAYGHGDAINSLGFDADTEGRTLETYYGDLEGVSFDSSGLEQLNSGSENVMVDEELFYELNSDLHLVDPCLIVSMNGWERSDIENIGQNIGPWFGNVLSRSHSEPPEGYRDEYEYYTLWEIAERVAAVFREQEKYERLKVVRDDLLQTIESNLPPEEERPTVGSIIYMEETFYPSAINASGFATADLRPFGVSDAFAGDDVTYDTTYDFETMHEVDPDVILHRFGISTYDVAGIRETLADHSVASQLTAIENDQFYASGHPVQGPLMNLFQLEMAAKQLYPDQFGEWPGFDGESYPEFSAEEQLFDRQTVANIVTGDY